MSRLITVTEALNLAKMISQKVYLTENIDIKMFFLFKNRYNDNIVCMDSLIRAKKGDCIGAIEYFKMHIKNYTDEAKDRFIIRLNKYAS